MWKSAIKEAFELAMSVTAFKWIINNFYEYRFYIIIGLIIIGILGIIGLVIERREKINRKQLEEQMKQK